MRFWKLTRLLFLGRAIGRGPKYLAGHYYTRRLARRAARRATRGLR